jgi:cytochrome P450
MNLIQFFVAGFETTYTNLNYCFYVLTKYPEEMVRLQDEIDSKLSYDDVRFLF